MTSRTLTLAVAVTACPVLLLTLARGHSNATVAKDEVKPANASVPNRPAVPGTLLMHLRSRPDGKLPIVKDVKWKASETAIIICDMWDDHYCKCAAQRVDAMAAKMNRVITAARNHGVMIIHAPSGCMHMYEGTPYRERMKQAKFSKSPSPLKRWCYLEKDKEKRLPIDDADSPCDDPIVGPRVRRYTRQHAGIKIIGYDGVSDNGQEVFNMLRQLGIKNVAIMGVHTNMCVLGRPFGIRQLTHLKFNVALVRDLTDAMYDPREYPYVSHTRGTELVVEHIEQHWCPSVASRDFLRVIPGSNNPDPRRIQNAKRDKPRR